LVAISIGDILSCLEVAVLLGFLSFLAFGCGEFVVKVWWVEWVRRFLDGRFLGKGFYADFWDLFCWAGEGFRDDDRKGGCGGTANGNGKYRDPSLRSG
jgi:hypothetical protein